jgi:BCD family chlorophyll transporter-like MFS transporter
MYVMLLLGTIVSALVFGAALADFSPGRLVQVIQASAVATLVLNTVALWKQETRRPARGAALPLRPTFRVAWKRFIEGGNARRRLAAIGVGTMAFSMQDVLLEPYGGQVLHMSVGATTSLTASLAIGGLTGFAWASRVLGRGADPFRMSLVGAIFGIPAFALVILAASLDSVAVFTFGVLLVGFGGGLFSHGTLTATMNSAPKDQIGLALGTWGAVQATCASVAVALGGIVSDTVGTLASRGALGPGLSGENTGYVFVYGVEIVMLAATIVLMSGLVAGRQGRVAAAGA